MNTTSSFYEDGNNGLEPDAELGPAIGLEAESVSLQAFAAETVLEALLRTAECGVCVIDADGVVRLANGPFLQLFARHDDSIIGKQFTQLVGPADRELAGMLFNEYLNGNDSADHEWLYRYRRNGESVITINSRRLIEGSRQGKLTVFIDRTKKRSAGA
jgi:PAS domain S-box-containing protein